MKYINIDSLVNFIKNGCIRILRDSLLDEHIRTVEIREFKNYGIIINGDIDVSDNIIDIGKIERVNIKEDDKIKLAIIIFLHNTNLCDEYKISYTNLFREESNSHITISKQYIVQVKRQIESGLKKIEESTKDKDLFIIDNHCEFCKKKRFEECENEILETNKLQILPIFTIEDIEYMHSNKINTLIELENSVDIFEKSHEFLKDKKDDIIKFLQKLHDSENKFYLLDKYYLNWNKDNEYKEYMITFQGHSQTDVVYAFAIKSLYETNDPKYIILRERPSNKKQVLDHYEEIIKNIYEYINKNHKDGKDTVFYALASYERKNFRKIVETLIEYQSDIKNLEKLLFVSEYFGFNYHSQEEVKVLINPFATTWLDIKSLIETYFVMNIPFKYTFKETLEVFCKNTLELNDNVIKGTFKMSWALKPKFVNKIWDKCSDIKIESIINSRIYYLMNLIKNFKDTIKEKQIEPDKRSFEENNTFLGRFIIKEAVTTIKEYKHQFAELPLDRLVEKGLLLKVNQRKLIKKYSKYKYQYQFNCSNFENLTEFTGCNKEFFVESERRKFLRDKYNWKHTIEVIESGEGNGLCNVIVNSEPKYEFYVANNCYSNQDDTNENKLIRNLSERKNSILNILNDTTYLIEYEKIEGLTSSQAKVHNQLCENKITLLWGPPGTGKTFCIGKMVNHILKNKPTLRILVTGFTNLSIENCLKKIVEHGADEGVVRKLGKVESSDLDSILLKYNVKKYDSDKKNNCFDTRNYNIVGSTAYQIDKIIDEKNFDLVIVDEASQLKMPEFLMTLNKVHEKTKFLIVGDHKQLPPIVKNTYLDENSDVILESGSIFDYLFNKGDYIVQIEDCFRMNKAISDYPSSKLYNSKLKSAEANKYQILEFNSHLNENNLLSYISQPQYPVTLCIVNNKVNKDSKNIIEAEFTANLSLFFKENLKYNGAFWNENLSVVSPHHSQISLIKQKLNAKFKNEDEKYKNFFVDTVDKMQGQESDIVIVSYGVTDPLIALKEKEFIYNLNRLNVSITRAKKKLIIIMSKGLLDINYKLVDDENMGEHIDFMMDYVNYIKQNDQQPMKLDNVEIYRLKL